MKMSNDLIRFLFRDKQVEIDLKKEQISPTTTVLRYLRETGCSTGTKEGCAEGDCGACSVVIASPDGKGKLHYKAVDSCLMFLPMIDGKQLITVEDLESEGQLHPVQQSMADCNGTQCGYCTPGFVMSLLALSKDEKQPQRADIEDALTGNLCRCTGYRPILEAASRCTASTAPDKFTEKENETCRQLSASASLKTLSIDVNGQQYFRPAELQGALSLLTTVSGLIPFSGATDLALRVTKKHERLTPLLDLSAISELQQLTIGDNSILIGSGVTLESLRQKLRTHLPALTDMLDVFGSRQIRTLATIGGNLGSASPIGDLLPVLMAYGAEILLQSEKGAREVTMTDFITGYRKTVRLPDELITGVRIPIPSPESTTRSYKVSKRKDLDISTVSAAIKLTIIEGLVRDAVIAFGGMAAKTERATLAETHLIGKPWDRIAAEAAADLVRSQFHPISDARSGAEFRSVAAGNLILKFWNDSR
jgi:xanthine dehydrogenase small subunit